jgi:hypothetical protein
MSTTELTANIDMGDLADYLALKDHLDELNAQAAQTRGEMSQVEERLVEQFALSGVSSMNVNGKTVYRNVEKYANARKEHRGELVAWARENGLDDMIVLQPASFKSWCREQLEGDDATGLPTEIAPMVDIFEKTSLRVRKA